MWLYTSAAYSELPFASGGHLTLMMERMVVMNSSRLLSRSCFVAASRFAEVLFLEMIPFTLLAETLGTFAKKIERAPSGARSFTMSMAFP